MTFGFFYEMKDSQKSQQSAVAETIRGRRAPERSLVVIPSMRGGGAERTLVNLLNRMEAKKQEIEVLIGIPGGVLEHEIPKEIRRKYLFSNQFAGRVCFWLFRKGILRAPLRLAWRVKTRGLYATMVSFQDCFLTDLVAESPNAMAKASIVHSNCETNPNYLLSSLSAARKQQLLEHRYRQLDTIAFVSKSARNAFVRAFGDLQTCRVLPILFSPSSISRLAAQSDGQAPEEADARVERAVDRRREGHTFRFICVGSLLPVKNHELLLRAASLLAREGYRFRLDLLGEGPLRSFLDKMKKDLGLEHRVYMHGFVSNPYPLMKSADVLVLPSISEAMPTVICEAHALNVPVLASDCDGCRDLLCDGRYGMLFGQTPEALADKMRTFIESKVYHKQCADHGRYWLAGYDEKKTLELYSSLISDGSWEPPRAAVDHAASGGQS